MQGETTHPPELSGPRDRIAIFVWMVGLFYKEISKLGQGNSGEGFVFGTQDHINWTPKGYSIFHFHTSSSSVDKSFWRGYETVTSATYLFC